MSADTPPVALGPTVSEYAAMRYKQINREIDALRLEKAQCLARMHNYANSHELESERRASAAEVFQPNQLPDSDGGEPD